LPGGYSTVIIRPSLPGRFVRSFDLDRLRELKRQHAEYAGPWLPELVVEDHMPSPEMEFEFSEEVSIGFLAVLEHLGPEERAAFLLHDVLD
jgi:RNA polymerase sigma-70 factor (ECF subfamily)